MHFGHEEMPDMKSDCHALGMPSCNFMPGMYPIMQCNQNAHAQVKLLVMPSLWFSRKRLEKAKLNRKKMTKSR